MLVDDARRARLGIERVQPREQVGADLGFGRAFRQRVGVQLHHRAAVRARPRGALVLKAIVDRDVVEPANPRRPGKRHALGRELAIEPQAPHRERARGVQLLDLLA
jgi:hypothetical protein